MNETRECKTLREEWGHLPAASLPEAPAAHVGGCPACAAFFTRQDALVGLLRLKQHEKPDAAFEGRLLHRVRTRLENTAEPAAVSARETRAPEAGRWSWMAPLAAAAGLAVAVSIYYFGPPDILFESEAPEIAATDGVAPTPAPVAVPAPELAVSPGAAPAPGTVLLDPDEHLRSLFRVEKTASNRMEQIVKAAEAGGLQVVEGLSVTNSRPRVEVYPVKAAP